jgi:hypothetical protein
MFSQGLEQQLHTPDPPYRFISSTAHTKSGSTTPGGTRLVPDKAAADTGLSLVQQLLLNQQQVQQQQQQQQQERPIMLMLPAFQMVPQQQQQQLVPDSQRLAVPSTKAELLCALQHGTVKPFDCGVFAPQQQVGRDVLVGAILKLLMTKGKETELGSTTKRFNLAPATGVLGCAGGGSN